MVHTDVRAYFQGLFIRVLFIDNSVIFRDLFPSESHAKFVFRSGEGENRKYKILKNPLKAGSKSTFLD